MKNILPLAFMMMLLATSAFADGWHVSAGGINNMVNGISARSRLRR